MKKFLIFLIGLYIGFIIFMPKENLFFTFQNYLKNRNIYINTKTSSNLISLSLKNFTLFINKIDIAKGEEISIFPFLFYNKIEAKNIQLNIQNIKINNIFATYSILNPIKIVINGNSNFGKINGYIDLIKKNIKIYLKNPSPQIKEFLQKDKKGYFIYEKF
ncbi:hypothetical protein FE773_00210 [Caminibacter mediatlanticus TB-2]|uniref:Uncharacterized protein n=1 Tax=Caminibacter mediatlanticus TB-2 TaxID=391592 RepID=A0AAI9F260_9BACT|nr:hypothetical protein [Caminibacter mediatlanticus]EDM23420.1 hypothetical protein CMTB2_09150 [Caminibacter mediatlanticus TB-2]QCT93665.1 hypothetical protein FE773_00210 [Caminibacter mediatlanticus TB-2]